MQDGPTEVQLAVSRDLYHCERPFRSAAIPRGRVAREFPDGSDEAYANSDWDSCCFNSVGPGLDVGDEVWVYYRAYNTRTATSGGGQIAIELLDRQGKVLGRSKPFSGDELRHRLEWEGPPGPHIAGRPPGGAALHHEQRPAICVCLPRLTHRRHHVRVRPLLPQTVTPVGRRNRLDGRAGAEAAEPTGEPTVVYRIFCKKG